MPAKKVTSYVCELTAGQVREFKQALALVSWEFDELQHARWRARKGKTTIVAYESGKLVVQGRGTVEVVEFILEPQILGEARMGNEVLYAQQEKPDMFQAHAGIDESGKGDYFGPLVVSAVYVTEESAAKLFAAGVQDSKAIKSDRKIRELSATIREVVGRDFTVVTLGPCAYNKAYDKIGNLNRLLAWGHARTLENLLERQPACRRVLADKFADERVMRGALMERGRAIAFEARTKAEDDIAVAAASILAREGFIRRLAELEDQAGLRLPRGASAVIRPAAAVIGKVGLEGLAEFAKLHFKTTDRAIAMAKSNATE
ncbi:MAG TPA: ribonuclease HIII [Lentisphaeria bacterium]|jgi:ribonuclease HIII|nr:ribonuclease HIII [Lentisphaeria bacterium]